MEPQYFEGLFCLCTLNKACSMPWLSGDGDLYPGGGGQRLKKKGPPPPCPTDTVSNEHFRSDRMFLVPN